MKVLILSTGTGEGHNSAAKAVKEQFEKRGIPSSISQPQQTVTKDKEPLSLEIHGRHDPVIVPRAVVVVESMAAITLADALFVNMSSQMDKVRDFYRK